MPGSIQQRTAAEPDALVEVDGTLFLHVSELHDQLQDLIRARAAGRAVVVLPDWEVYPCGDQYLLVLKLLWNPPATQYVGLPAALYPQLRAVIRADRLFVHTDIPETVLRQTAADGTQRADARAIVRQRAFLVNGLADGLIQLAYQLRQEPWRDVGALTALREALPRVRPKPDASAKPTLPHA